MSKFLSAALLLLPCLVSPAWADLPALVSDHQLLQRQTDAATSCTIPLESLPFGLKQVWVEVQSASETLLLERELAVEELAPGLAGVTLAELPTGGPYLIRIADAQGHAFTTFTQVLVGDLWVAAGQSNMQGVIPPQESLAPNPRLKMLGMDGRWIEALPPTHRIYDANVPIINTLIKRVLQKTDAEIVATREASLAGQPEGGVGPDYFFAEALLEQTGVPVGLIPCAFGGTSLSEWDPALRDQGDASLYGFMFQRVLQSGGQVAGVIWYQGENEASGDDLPRAMYADRFAQFVTALRADFDAPELPVIIAQLSRFPRPEVNIARGWDVMREIQRTLPERLPHVHTLATVDLPLYDGLHISYEAEQAIGRRMAHVAAGYADARLAPRSEIKLVSARVEGDFRDSLRVEYSGVTGQLGAAGAPSGFQVRSAETREPLDVIFLTRFEGPSTVVLRTSIPLPRGTQLFYGAGPNPYANIVDSAGVSLPAMGPITLE